MAKYAWVTHTDRSGEYTKRPCALLQAMAQAHEQVRRAMEAFEAQLTQLRALGCQMQQCATLNRGTARQLQEALPGHTLVSS